MYEFLLVVTTLVCLLAIIAGAWLYRDTFHPLVYLGGLLAVLYVGYPVYLLTEGELGLYFGEPALIEIQSIYLAGVAAMLLGTWKGAGRPAKTGTSRAPAISEVYDRDRLHRLRRAAAVLGLISAASFVYTLILVGGIEAAFSQGYGGGWHDSGYVRELFQLTLPALLWLMVAYQSRRPGLIDWGIIVLIASPLLMQGLLGARRGPTFMAAVGLGVGWYLMRRTRPYLVTVLLGGVVLGGMLLYLVTNRGEIHLGSDLEMESRPLEYFKAGTGNEYLYGGAVMLHAQNQGQIFWGGRYVQFFLIHAIPKSLWPTKYEDTSRVLGVPAVDTGNAGLPTHELLWSVGWIGADGAAPGIVADFWVEFWWFGLAGLFAVGWLYGWSWRMAMTKGGGWIPWFGILTSVSIYVVMQDLESMGFRALLMLAGSSLVWTLGRYGVTLIQAPPESWQRPMLD
jgi:hypothetical protein